MVHGAGHAGGLAVHSTDHTGIPCCVEPRKTFLASADEVAFETVIRAGLTVRGQLVEVGTGNAVQADCWIAGQVYHTSHHSRETLATLSQEVSGHALGACVVNPADGTVVEASAVVGSAGAIDESVA